MPVDLAALESRARAATPGPWHVGNGTHWGRNVRAPDRGEIAWCGGESGLADARYIADASPDVVLELIERVRELEATRDAALARTAQVLGCCTCTSSSTCRRCQIDAALGGGR